MEDLAGYRVLRSAGHGQRATLLVGFDDGETVVLKTMPFGDAAAGREIEALERAAGDHVVGLRDVDSDGERVVLVLERLGRGTLGDLLERRGSLDPGEAVTILAPLAATVERLHEAGVAHGGLSPAAICFGDDGSPTLVGFGAAELFAPGSPEVVRETVAGVIADRGAFRGLVDLVLARVPGADRRRATSDTGSLAALAAALFDLATPAPVRFDSDPGEAGVNGISVAEADPVVDAEPPSTRLPAWLAVAVPDVVRDRLEEPLARIAAVWSAWSSTRRRLVVGGAAGALAVLVVLAALPPPAGEPAATGIEPPSTPSAGEPAALPDDPVESATILLRAREQCIRDLSVLCLDDVVQPGSAAASSDAALIRGLRDGGEYPGGEVPTGDPVLVERLGDSALLDLPPGSSPASVLLLRTTNGWRLRQYFEIPGREAPAVTTTGD